MRSKKRYLLVSLGAYGINPLIPNGKEIANILRTKTKNLKIISTDKYMKDKKYLRYIKYILDIARELSCKEKSIMIVHMNTPFAEILHRLQAKKYIKILTWYSHVNISRSATYILKRSNQITTASTNVKSKYPKAILTHCITLPSKDQIKKTSEGYISRDFNKLVFIGRFSTVKRIDRFINLSISSYNLELIKGCKLMAIDHEEDVKNDVLNKLSRAKIPKEIYINKDVKSIYEILKNGDILVNLSEELGLNKVMLEASSLGIPVLSNSKIYYNYFEDYKCLKINEPYREVEAIKALKNWQKLTLSQKDHANKLAINKSTSFSVNNYINNLLCGY